MNRWIATLAVLGATTVATSASAQVAPVTNIEGNAEGQDFRELDVNGLAPLLDSFFFDYWGEVDRPLHHIGVNLDDPLHHPEDLTVAFEDDGNDDFFYHAQYRRTSEFNTTMGWGADICAPAPPSPGDPARGSCTLSASRPGLAADWVFVLTGFRMYYWNQARAVDQIAVYERNGVITIALNDRNDDDTFVYHVTWQWVPRSRFTTVATVSGSANGHAEKQIPAGPAVIRGFSADFRTGDSNLAKFGVWTRDNPSQIEVRFSDRNNSNLFDYFVDYAILAPLATASPSGPVAP
jgi:hypothetical protein